MQKKMRVDEAFQALLEGESVKAPPALSRLAALTKALEPVSRPGPDARFQARLRSEILAMASMTEEDVFAELLEGSPVEAPPELRPLVALAVGMAPRSLPAPDVAFRYQLRNKLITQAGGPVTVRDRIGSKVAAINERMRRSLRVVAATGMAASMMLGSSAALAASSSALPGDSLYGVKQLRESAQLLVVSGEKEGLRLLNFAETRFTEVKGLEDRQEQDQSLYVSTFSQMDEQTERGATLIITEFRARNGAAPAAMQRLRSFAAGQQSGLTAILGLLPPGARPAAQDSIDLARDVEDRAATILVNPACPCPDNPVVQSPEKSDGIVGCDCDGSPQVGPGADRGTDGSAPDDSGNDPDGTEPDPGNGGGGDDTDAPKPVDLPPVGGTDADDDLEDTINDIIDGLPSLPPLPSPVPSVPSLLP